MSDYIYKNADDTIRVKLYQRETGKWDADVWVNGSDGVIHYGSDLAVVFATRREAKQEVTEEYGKLVSINPETVTGGW